MSLNLVRSFRQMVEYLDLSNADDQAGGQLMAAALGMIALEGAFLTYAADKKLCGVVFWCASASAFLSFVLSVIRGGKGISLLYKTERAAIGTALRATNIFNGRLGSAA